MMRVILKIISKQYGIPSKLDCKRYFGTKLSYVHNIGKDPLRAITIGQLLEECTEKYGDRKAVISMHQNSSITFSETLKKADTLATGLLLTGLEKGDRLGLCGPNTIEWYLTMMACARAGIILVPINPAFQVPELKYCLQKVGIKAIISPHTFKTQNYYNMIKQTSPEISFSKPGKMESRSTPSLKTVIIISDEKLNGTYNFNQLMNMADDNGIKEIKNMQSLIRPDEGCNIQFTSGTTGNPKGTYTSHFQFINSSYEIGKRNELNVKYHKICVNVPLFHVFGTIVSVMASLNYGASMVLPSPTFNPTKSLEAIRDEKCTIIHGTPTMYVDLIEKQKQLQLDINPEIAVAGGAPCSPHLFHQMQDILRIKKVKSVYGLTETTAVNFQSLPNDDEQKSTSTVGYVHDHIEVKVVDENDNTVPIGTPGELCVRGYCNMLGYWGDEEKTNETIRQGRWLKTGDQFVLQENGYGRIIGRLKDMIIRGGENIFPKEIEDYLNTHPSILEAHVIGVLEERLGEEVCACIRLQEGTQLSLEDVKTFCKGKLAHFKIPSKMHIVTDFPKTQSGKIQKNKLREMFNKKQKF